MIAAPRLAVPLVALAALAAFGASLGFDFVMDDWPQIVQNANLRRMPWGQLLAGGVWEHSPLAAAGGDVYRPVFLAWLAGLARLGGSAAWFHAGGVALHVAATVLVWALGRRLAGPVAALLGALLFAVHPVHVASVAWVSGATDPLAAIFALAAALAWLRWLERPRPVLLAAVAVAYGAALAAKEVAIVLPAALVLLAPEAGRRRHGIMLAVLAGVAATWLLARHLALGSAGAEAGLSFDAAGLGRLADAAAYAAEGLVFGVRGHFFRPPAAGLASGLALPALAVLALTAWAAPRRVALAAGGWAALFLAPNLAVAFHADGAFAARFLYLSSVGVCLVAGAALARLPIRGAVAATAVLAAAGVAATQVLAADWRDDGRFYAMVIELAPNQGSGYAGLARHHLRRGQPAAAEAVYARAGTAIADEADRFSLIEDHALLLARAGRLDEAAGQFQRLAGHPRFRRVGLEGLRNVALAQGNALEARRLSQEIQALGR